jgi:hypothetical protein
MLQCLLHPAHILKKQARQKDLAPQVLALSVSQTGDRRPKDSGGANHHYKMCKEITSKETNKQIFIQHRNDDYLNDLRKLEKGKRGSEKLFLLFPFSNLFY